MRNAATRATIRCALLIAAIGGTAQAATVTLGGVVPTLCEAAFADGPVASTTSATRRIDLGRLTRRCNDARGYRLILHSAPDLGGAVLVAGGRRVPLSRSGRTTILDSDRIERVSEAAYIELAAPRHADMLDLRLEILRGRAEG